MTDDDAFLATIRAHPGDRLARLVYADWLEERGDPRHELLRVCERMRQVPVFSDDYWQLKARRDALRPACPPDWLAATGTDGGDYDPVFRDGIPDGWRERWRLIRAFTERWHGLPMGDVGGRRAEVAAAEERLGLALPPSVREYVAYAHDVFPRPDSRVVHRDPYTMEPIEGQDALSLMVLSEGGVNWAVRYADLALSDPPLQPYYCCGDDMWYVAPNMSGGPGGLSGFVLDFTTTYKPDAGHFSCEVTDIDRLRVELRAAFGVRWGEPAEHEGYEHDAGILAVFRRDVFNVTLEVCVRRGVGWESVPAFLWEYARRDDSRSGVFRDRDNAEETRGQSGHAALSEFYLYDAPLRVRLPLNDGTPF